MTNEHGDIEPIAGPEAFEAGSVDAQWSQAALVLAAAAGVGGRQDVVPDHEEFPLPALEPLHHPGPIPLEEAVSALDVDTAEYVEGFAGEIPSEVGASLARRLYDAPEPATAAALVEAALHSPHPIVRTAGAAAALDTTGPREDVIAELESAAASSDANRRALGRVALARANPQHPLLQRYVSPSMQIRRGGPSHTAVLTHGTFAADTNWWRPGGDFYKYLDSRAPALHLHNESFHWSGIYSHPARKAAAAQLIAWTNAEGLVKPDFFAHSHGTTVANLATQSGLQFDRLVMLAWPVYAQWLPDLARVGRVISIRVRFDLVIVADGGEQRLPASFQASPKVEEHINGWFKHEDPHEPDYWDRHNLLSVL